MSFLLVATLVALAEPTRDVLPEDQFSLDEARTVAANHNGTRLVYVRARWDDALDKQRTDLWALETASRATTRLTFDHPDAHAPRFGPQDQHVLFLAADADGTTQVWRMPATGGAARQLTQGEQSVDHYDVDVAGRVWWVTTKDEPADDGWKALRDAWPDASYEGRTHARSTVHRLDLSTWRAEEVWQPHAYIAHLDVTEDGSRLAAVTAPSRELLWQEGFSDVRLVELATGTERRLPDAGWRAEAPSPYGWIDGLAWASDGRALAVRVDYDGHPGETFVAELAGGEPRLWKVPRPGTLQVMGGPLRWVPGERELCERMADHGRVRLVCTPKLRAGGTGKPDIFPRGDVVVNAFTFSGDGRDIYAVVGTPTRFPDLYRLPARGNLFPVLLMPVNPHADTWKLPTTRVVSWTTPDGAQVEGVLETPYGWTKEQGPLPTVLLVHGGPTAMETVQRTFHYGGRTTLAAKGWAVLAPNYRGSTGYGDAFTTALVGHENEVEVADLLAGVDHLISEGIADADRLAVMGWSNGGYLTNALLTHTTRFKAAISGAGVIDQALQWATEDTPGHVINFMGGPPWAAKDAYVAASPLYALGSVRTPTLLHVGEDDERVPAAHARALFRALDVYLDVPTELIVYPGAPHGLKKLSERRTKVAWDLAWLERYVLGAAAAPVATEPAAAPSAE